MEGRRERERERERENTVALYDSVVICCSYMSRLVECVDPILLETHSAALGMWLTETKSDVTMKLTSRCCEHLYGVFMKKQHWNYVVELLLSCNRYIHELGPRVCEPLDTALHKLGPVTKLISIAEKLREDQMARMSSEVSRYIFH